jgi:TolB-like protein/Tfp pilus assembly protein PilF/class 3 adenylate cyclase
VNPGSSSSSDVKFEIGHVLFIDIVGYSKLLITEQSEQLQTLKEIVRGTEQVRLAEAEGELLRLPTGDGGALVFRNSPEAPVLCAMEIAEELQKHPGSQEKPQLRLRMGIHSGPVNEVTDLNEQANIAGAGINIAQRVMDCGGAGHILLSKRVADDLEQYGRWRPCLHDLGECEVKHGAMIDIVNLYTDEIGNPQPPKKFKGSRQPRTTMSRRATRTLAVTIVVLTLGLGLFLLLNRTHPTKSPVISNAPIPNLSTDDKSIAVLPFVDLSQAKDQEYFCDGISEEILDALAKIEGLRVVARTSSFAFKGKTADVNEIAKKLNVSNVLEGSLRREGNRIRVAVQLINARDGFHTWSQTYEHELQGVFAVQDEITRAVVDALEIKLAVALPAHKKPNTEAYDLYLKGRYFLNRKTQADAERAIDYFEQTLIKDPNSAPAYAGLADSYSSLVFPLGAVAPREVMPKAKEAALRALAIDNAVGEAHASLAYIAFFYDWDWAAAEKGFKRALELNPNNADTHHWYSHFLMSQGRFEESLTQSKRALQLSPFDMLMNVHLAWHYLYARQYDQALDQIEKTIEMDRNFAQAYPWLGLTLEQKGRYPEAIAAFQKAIKLFPGGSSIVEAELAHAYAVSGNREAALKIIDELQELAKNKYVSAFQIAAIYAGLGDKDKTFVWLEKAFAERSDGLVNLNAEQRFDSLRGDARFETLMRKVVGPK